jgi:two-component SAPR family response regulator
MDDMGFKIKVILFIFFVSIWKVLCAQEDNISSGLYFSSHEVNQDQRTSLHITPERPLVLKKGFSIEFEARFRQGDGYYGSICRIIGDGKTNIDLISNLGSENSNFWMVVKDEIPFSYKFSEIPNSNFGNWIKVRIDLDLDKSMASVSFNGNKKQSQVKNISQLRNFDIVFGACSNPQFLNTDVSPMSLKNIVIYDNKNRIIRNWRLSKHGNGEVLDLVKKDKAVVKNGTWLIDHHIKWSNLRSFKMPDLAGIAKNEKTGTVYLIGKDFMLAYSVVTNHFDTIKYIKGCPFHNYLDYFIFNQTSGDILSYDISGHEINTFNFTTLSWDQSTFAYKEPDYAHHSRIISPIDGKLYTFGGYGHYKYKSVLNSCNISGNIWNSKDLSSEIYPRYLCASGLDENNNWLIFGGYGSKSGRQELSPQYYFDFYSYDFKSEHFKKLNEYDALKIPFVPCDGLVKKKGSNSFYSMIYNTTHFSSYLHLVEFKTDVPQYTLFNDSIPYSFSDIESWSTFFLHENSSRLISITAHKSDVAIYALNYPPLLDKEVIQAESKKGNLIIYILVILVAVVTVMIVLLRKKKEQVVSKSNFRTVQVPTNDEEHTITNLELPTRKSKSSVYFLGGFQVFDKEGNDITASFTPTLKQLFIIVFLYMVQNGRGISTTKLNETLWFDKSETSARNNRNVSISKLRLLLDKVGNMDIEQINSYWKITLEGIYSDYIEVNSMIEKFKNSATEPSESEIIRFIQVISNGELLPNLQNEWIDEFKANFSNMVLDTLFNFSGFPEIQHNHQQLNDIADCILKYDPINEEAIKLKCSTLCKLGKKGLAKTVYDHFKKEYENLLGTEFTITFADIVENK